MNSIVLECNQVKGFSILLKESDFIPTKEKIFTLYIEDIRKEYDRIRNLNLRNCGLAPESKEGIFEYPMGENFMLIDPGGNRFLISSLLPADALKK